MTQKLRSSLGRAIMILNWETVCHWQIPLVIFTSMENYPITQVIPRTRVLSEVLIYLAYNHGDSGHYNLAVEVTRAQSNSSTTINRQGARQAFAS